jgi:hypothetical protein
MQQAPGTTPVVTADQPLTDPNVQTQQIQAPPAETASPVLLDLQTKLSLSDKARVAAQTQLDELQRREKTDLQNAQNDLTKVAAENEILKADLQNERLGNAFLTAGKHEWQNAGAALRLLDRTMITFAEDGTVTGVDKAADALAKSDPYLLKTATTETSGKQTPAPPAPPSGTQPSQGAGNSMTSDRDRLLRKYAVLRR